MSRLCRYSRERMSAELQAQKLRPPFVVPPSGGSASPCPGEQAGGFSLVEVVLAIGIFSFAMVAILGLFGSSIGGVKKLADRDILVAAGGMVAEKLSDLPRAEMAGLPSGTNPAGRPTFYAYERRALKASDAFAANESLAFTTNTPPPASEVSGGRVIRARIFRARESASSEFAFGATNISFPVRVVVDLLAPGQDNEAPSLSWSFHRVLVPSQ